MEVSESKEETKGADEQQIELKPVLTLYRFDYLSLKWIDTIVNLNGIISQKLDRYQYLYIEESNKIMFLGLVNDPFAENYE